MSVVVVKLGGHALDGATDLEHTLDMLASDLASLANSGTHVVLVHGAGPQISELLTTLGIPVSFVDGLRVTDAATMNVVAMSLGLVNQQLVLGLQRRQVRAVGLSGVDAGMVTATSKGERWQRAGDVTHVDTSYLSHVLAQGFLPVVSPVSASVSGELMNCNADAVAGALAAAVRADALVLLSDVDRLRRDPDDPNSAVASATVEDVEALMASGAIRDGMTPKMHAALTAVTAGARRVVLANGTRAGALANALSDARTGTEITA